MALNKSQNFPQTKEISFHIHNDQSTGLFSLYASLHPVDNIIILEYLSNTVLR